MGKRFFSTLLVLIFFISAVNFKVVFAASDVTPPTINGMTWTGTDLHVGDKLEVEIDASDLESGIATGDYQTSIYIEHSKTYISKGEMLQYDEANKMLKATFTITSDMQSGEWQLSFVCLKDKANNIKYFHRSDFNKQYKINVIGATSDITPPTIKDMSWTGTDLKVGDKLEVEIDASDEESGIATGDYQTSIYIEHSKTYISKGEMLEYDEVSKTLKATFTITSDMQSGEWQLSFVCLKDKANNIKYFHRSDFNKEYKINIIGETSDITPPTIKDMSWTGTDLKVGDKLEVTIDASDLESGIATGDYQTGIYIEHSKTYISKGEILQYDEANKMLKATFTITSNMQSGEWILSFVCLKDNANNIRYFHRSDFNQQYKINVLSVFSGTDNSSIVKGTTFNPLDGVKAESTYEGDFTDKITYSGSVDTSSEGIYLIKYEANGKNGDVYRDYRWITVVNDVHYDENGQLDGSYFNGDVPINISNVANSSSIDITKDGSQYSLGTSNVISEEGVYNLSFDGNSSNNIVNSALSYKAINSTTLTSTQSGDSSGKKGIKIIVDKTKPTILNTMPKAINEGVKLQAKDFLTAQDNSGKLEYSFVSEPKWTNLGDQIVNVKAKDFAGNYVTSGVKLKIVDRCDMDKSGTVDMVDMATVAQNYEHNTKDYKDKYIGDFNNDGVVDIFDIVTLSKRLK
ncbi:DUF5011 domain-containing protein [Clostridium sp. YIM B02505]|uniref:DUF5011 domain-containing protein n=1 Tax=Clostridium yunnanense TaxID=2800325 RepID=A0ABS1EWY9_9CLOT|nr:immunoglobulin-like domain-containing protein [Clostridium yunnanense]MBK1813868.1 DUF5011 domain-containing protein [Clostridium yunnanense]